MQLRPFAFRGIGRDNRNKIDLVLADAQHALNSGDYKRALVLGGDLEKLRYLYASAVQAAAWKGVGRPDKGIEALRHAVHRHPKAWLLWLELGDMLGSARRFPEAYEAYDGARRCPDVKPHLVDVHRAKTLSADGRHMDAIDLLADIPADDYEIKIEAILAQVDIFNAQDGAEFVFGLVDRGLKIIGLHPERNYRTEQVRLHTAAGRACLLQQDRAGARDNARRAAIELRRGGCPQTLELLRDIHDVRSRQAWFYWLSVKGHNGIVPFKTSYGVVAEAPEEGLELARDIESKVVGPSLKLQSFEQVEPSPGALKGVYDFTDWVVQRSDTLAGT